MQRARAAQAMTTGFTFDSTAIATPPTGGLPTELLTRTVFEDGMLQRALVGTTEPFSMTGELGARRDLESQTRKLERDPTAGRVLVLSKTESGPATPRESALLQRNALARLQRRGIPPTELGPVWQTQSFIPSEERGVVGLPSFTATRPSCRAINGIRVEGHRAVVTHGVDGRFQRALVSWPPLAREGHLLRTRLSMAEIEQRARAALLLEGEPEGPVRLFWKYVPTQLST